MATREREAGRGRTSREALADTWFDQATGLLERIRDEATEAELQEALSQDSSVSGISMLLSRAAKAVSDFDELAPALLRGVRERDRLLEEAGGGLTRTQVAELLDLTPAAVDQRRRRGQLLFVESIGGQYLYPQIQFTSSGTLPHLADVLGWMRVKDGWMRLDMLTSEMDSLGGRSPIDVMASDPSDELLEELRSALMSWGA
jgi:hypothetical protein